MTRLSDLPPPMQDHARRQMLGQPSAEEERSAHITEKQEQAVIVRIFRAAGCKVYSLSQARATKQTPGLPDLWVVHLPSRQAWWFECKRQRGGVLSEFQKDFRDESERCGVRSFVGDRYDARMLLEQLGIE